MRTEWESKLLVTIKSNEKPKIGLTAIAYRINTMIPILCSYYNMVNF